MFRTVPLSISGVFHCTHNSGICHTACEQDQDGPAVPFWSCLQAVSKPVWHIPLLRLQWKTPDDGQRNCPKHVEFYSKNKFLELVHLCDFIVRIYRDVRFTVTLTSIYRDARSPERQKCNMSTIIVRAFWQAFCIVSEYRV